MDGVDKTDDRYIFQDIRHGESLVYSVYSLHRRTAFYGDDAEEFRPERWDKDLGLLQNEVTKSWGYPPFNGGPRACLGSESPYFLGRQS